MMENQPDLFCAIGNQQWRNSGATMAQNAAPLSPASLTGQGRGAKVRHSPAPNGAVVARPDPARGAVRVAQLRDLLREAVRPGVRARLPAVPLLPVR